MPVPKCASWPALLLAAQKAEPSTRGYLRDRLLYPYNPRCAASLGLRLSLVDEEQGKDRDRETKRERDRERIDQCVWIHLFSVLSPGTHRNATGPPKPGPESFSPRQSVVPTFGLGHGRREDYGSSSTVSKLSPLGHDMGLYTRLKYRATSHRRVYPFQPFCVLGSASRFYFMYPPLPFAIRHPSFFPATAFMILCYGNIGSSPIHEYPT